MKGYGRYSQAYQKAAVNTTDQRKLILMLYDGAIRFLTAAAARINKGDHYEAHKNLVKGKSIIAELLASLNLEQGGDIAGNLQRLYTYMFNELIEANVNKDVARITQVITLLKELRVGWQSLNGAPSQQQPDVPAAQEPEEPARKSINLKG